MGLFATISKSYGGNPMDSLEKLDNIFRGIKWQHNYNSVGVHPRP